tara:strand:- start:21216 stop:23012 length:1797 start_codon:yes stop_codon:yes gene_type:complete
MHYFHKIFKLLKKSERKKFIMLILLSLVMSLIDMIGIASILPFMAVLGNMDLLETNKFLNLFFQSVEVIGITEEQQFIYFLGLLVFLLLIFSLIFKSLTLYLQIRFVYRQEHSIGMMLIESYLHQPYSWFLNQNISELGKNILSEVSIVINQFLMPLINFISNTFVVLVLLLMLIYIDPLVAFTAIISLSILYGFIFIFAKSYLDLIGKKRLASNQVRFSTIIEALAAFKEIKIGGLKDIYINRFGKDSKNFANYQTSANVISRLPRFGVEALAFGGMLLLLLFLINQKNSISSALPILALYALAGYRVIPSLQQAYSSVTQMRYSVSSLNQLYKDFIHIIESKQESFVDAKKLSFNKLIRLNNINYNYPNSSSFNLRNMNIEIKAGSKVAFIGSTGSGKTTTIDLILGLLQTNSGSLEVDNNIITDSNRRAWQKNIGYVPQNIYLADDTIASNIAFGIDHKQIDYKAVERAAKIASIHEFIINDLPKKYETNVGERGIRLSGGQLQRIGIARAFYHNSKVIILDEATNALDDITEQSVMDTIYSLDDDLTIILIAHRLNTIRKCDQIFLLEKGEVKAQGTYEELKYSNLAFKKMLLI